MAAEDVTAADPRVAAFVDALSSLERDGEVDPLCQLYGDDAEVGSVQSAPPARGPEAARAFWTSYRASVGAAHSRFRSIVVEGDRAALEWQTESPAGEGVSYDGVTMLEFDGPSIQRSWAYFNPAVPGERLTTVQEGE